MAEIVVAVASKVVEYSVVAVRRQIGYVWNCRSNFENLKRQAEKLQGRRESMLHLIEEARRNGEEIDQVVLRWIDSVTMIIDVVKDLIEDYEEGNRQRCRGLCPNLKKRYQYSKKAALMSEKVAELYFERAFHRISYRVNTKEIWHSSSDAYEDFESRHLILEKITHAISSRDVDTVGVYGMAGVGKTTLVKEVSRQVKIQKLFDAVILVELSEKPDIIRTQGLIADQLGLKFVEETVEGRARRLYHRLKQEREVLLILDNISGSLDLVMVGIPSGFDNRGCKLLLTSRNLHVLTNEMECHSIVYIDPLLEIESWSLFKKIAGYYVEQHDIRSVAIDVAKACGGVPLAIVTVARTLRNRDAVEWTNVLEKLSRSSSGILEVMEAIIRSSYDSLESEELKLTFLLCSMMEYTDDAYVGDLLRYAMGLGIFQGSETIEEAHDRVATVVQTLKSSYLLLDTPDSERFSIQYVVRDVARSIASDQHMFVIDDFAAWDGADKDKFKNCKAISLHDIRVLPKGLECPQLEFLCMKTSDPSLKVPKNADDFFTKTPKIRVLHFTGMNLSSLLRSLVSLTNLHTLCMNQCKLQDVAVIGCLQKLEILSLRNSHIEELPAAIGQLTGLRLLDLSHCSNLEVITPDVISKLTRLEELYMNDTSIQWTVEGPGNERSNTILYELKNLQYLTALEILIEDAELGPEVLFSHSLKRYKIVVGGNWGYCEWYKKDVDAATLKASAINDEIIWHNQLSAMCFLVENLTHLVVQGCDKLRYLFPASMVNSFKQLQNLEICECTVLEEIIKVEQLLREEEARKDFVFPQLNRLKINDLESLRMFHSANHCNFPSLRELEIENCPTLQAFIFNDKVELPSLEQVIISGMDNLKTIWHDQLSENSFCKLKSLEVNDCQKLLTVIPSFICGRLLRLEFLTVKSCGLVEEIFDLQGLNFEEKHSIEATQLRELYIDHLPNLKHIWNEDPQSMLSFQELQKVKVFLCSNLKNLFPSSVGRSLLKLESLEVSDCGVEEIVAKGGVYKAAASLVFPELSSLQLHCLPELRTFYPGHIVEAPYLKCLGLHYCDKLKILIISGCLSLCELQQPCFLVGKGICMLEKLQVSGKTVKMEWQGQVKERLFRQLKSLELSDDESKFLTLGVIEGFQNLEKLSLICGSYQEIFPYDYAEDYIGRLSEIKHLVLNGLQGLTQIYGQDTKESLKFQNLEILEVQSCFNLINLMPSSTSFQNLTILRVWGCEALINFIASSAATSLLRLVEMEIFDCGMMTEIVANDQGVTKDEIVFNSLKSLSLLYLRSLTCFYSGNYTLIFPSLENLVVNECPKMEIFYAGDIHTPKLQQLAFSAEPTEHFWEGDINSTIQQYHKNAISWKKRLQ